MLVLLIFTRVSQSCRFAPVIFPEMWAKSRAHLYLPSSYPPPGPIMTWKSRMFPYSTGLLGVSTRKMRFLLEPCSIPGSPHRAHVLTDAVNGLVHTSGRA